MPKVEDRFRPGKGARPKRLTSIPGLASLLADAPRERLVQLAGIWALASSVGPGLAAALYHQMTNREAIDVVLRGLGEATRLALTSLVARSGPTRRSTVARLVPFAEGDLDAILARLEETGLTWRLQSLRQTNEFLEVWWIVPRDISRVLRAGSSGTAATRPPSDQPSRELAMVPSHGHVLTTLVSEPYAIEPIESAAGIIDRVLAGETLLAIMSEAHPERVRDAAHLGIAMGVLEAQGRVVLPGPRSGAWRILVEPERIRALTRMWAVDDTGSKSVPAPVRRGVISALLTGDAGRWYDANSLARLTAGLVASVRPVATSLPDRGPVGSLTIDRASVDRAIISLAVVGAISITLDRRERPTSFCLSPAGFQAIR